MASRQRDLRDKEARPARSRQEGLRYAADQSLVIELHVVAGSIDPETPSEHMTSICSCLTSSYKTRNYYLRAVLLL
jgi:hypothetical protein